MAKVQFLEFVPVDGGTTKDYHSPGIVARDTEGRIWYHALQPTYGTDWTLWNPPEKPLDNLERIWPSRNILPDALSGLNLDE